MHQVALITGSSRGIGRATALTLAAQGFSVAVHYLHAKQQAEELTRQIQSMGVKAESFSADVSQFDQVERMIGEIEKKIGGIGVLVNNAGIAQQRLFTDITPEEWHRMMGVHIDGAYHCCRCVLPAMIHEKRGKIVNISSIWGITGASCEVHYSTAKAAIIGLTKALAKELGPSHIQVNCVAPGVIETDMLAEIGEETKSQLASDTPLQRIGTPQDIADTIAFLVSDKSDFITGQILSPNGGYVI